MLIYGNTPRDIMRLIKQNRWRVIALVLALTMILMTIDRIQHGVG